MTGLATIYCPNGEHLNYCGRIASRDAFVSKGGTIHNDAGTTRL